MNASVAAKSYMLIMLCGGGASLGKIGNRRY
jgi:hypothetical protein